MLENTKPNMVFWIIAIFALLWNLMGVFFWLTEYFLMTEKMKAALSPEQVELMQNDPSWGMYIYAIAVFGGVFASILLLMRKKNSVVLFNISLVCLLILQGYWIFFIDIEAIAGPQALIMPIIVIAIGIFESFYSKGAAQNGWLE